MAYGSSESGRREVYVRPFPKVGDGKWQVSRTGGTEPQWAHSGRELFYVDGAGALVAAAVSPSGSFAMGAQTTLFDVGPFLKYMSSVYYDVAPDDKRFLFLHPVREQGMQGPDKLVQIVNWGAEVHAKLTGKKP